MATKENINQALLDDVMSIYNNAEIEMIEKVAKRVAKGVTETGWNETKLQETQDTKKELSKLMNSKSMIAKSKVSKGIIKAYEHGLESASNDKKANHVTILDKVAMPKNLKVLVLESNKLLDNASFQVLRNANDAYREVMANATTGLLVGTDTRVQASQKMLNEYAAKGITTFQDKAGRNWNLSSYSEMCARTISSHAALQGHIDRSLELGEDLVKVSSIGTTCPICAAWQSVVLSISGKSNGYISLDSAKAAGLFHPNCKHTVSMHIPELDGEGQKEKNVVNQSDYGQQRNKLIEQQRANERNIRAAKHQSAAAITLGEKIKCEKRVKYYQHRNLLHCTQNNLRRQYAREGNMSGYAEGKKGAVIGGTLKEFEGLYKDVIGADPKQTFGKIKMNLQMFSDKEVTYDKWLKSEIKSLDMIDIEKAQLKDVNNKEVTPTSLFKKYISDTPSQDYILVSPYEKGSNEFKKGYAKWLKDEVDSIGVTYKIKPKYKEITEYVSDEDKSLSATALYKKYYDVSPTYMYQVEGGEEMTGMKYGKWVETQKKILIEKGMQKMVPFDNVVVQKAVEKNNKVISEGLSLIEKAKLNTYKVDLDINVNSAYTASQEVKYASELVNEAKILGKENEIELANKMYDIAKEKDLQMNKVKAKKMQTKESLVSEIDTLKNVIDNSILTSEAKVHVQNKMKIYKDKLDAEYGVSMVDLAKNQAEKMLQKETKKEAKKETKESNKISIGREVSFTSGQLVEQSKIYNEIDFTDLEVLAKQAKGNSLMAASRKDVLGRDSNGSNHHMGHNTTLKNDLSKNDKVLGEDMKVVYDDFINTIKCNDINLACAKGYDNASPSMQKTIDSIDRAIKSSELTEPIMLNRFLSNEVAEKMFGNSKLKGLKEGTLVDNPSFMSTTVSGHATFEKRDIMMSIQCDKGTHVLPTLNYEEGEVILGRDGKLEIIQVIDHKDNPKMLTHYDGSTYKYTGKEVVTRYIEPGRALEYEMPTPASMDKMLSESTSASSAIIKNHTKKEAKEWADSLTSNERDATKKYTGSWYTGINNVGRIRGKKHDDDYSSRYDTLTSALGKASTEKPIVLRRGLYSEDVAHMLGLKGNTKLINDEMIEKINKGGFAAEDKGFLSTSPLQEGGFSKNSELKIYCPTGTHAAYVDEISSVKGEKETLLNSGSMFKIMKIKANSRSGYTVWLELLGTN